MSDVLLGKIDLLKIENARLTADLEAERARVRRLRCAFLRAEGELENVCPQQDQTMATYLRRWGLDGYDLDSAATDAPGGAG